MNNNFNENKLLLIVTSFPYVKNYSRWVENQISREYKIFVKTKKMKEEF